jgi:predicted PhzF superfamily epimerase YddE/YHI9
LTKHAGRDDCVIDTFIGERHAGNPGAVVFEAEGLDETRMQAIAAKNDRSVFGARSRNRCSGLCGPLFRKK